MRDRDESDYPNPKRFNVAYFLRKRANEQYVRVKNCWRLDMSWTIVYAVINWEKYF